MPPNLFFDKYATTHDPWDKHHMNLQYYHPILLDDPCVLSMREIFSSNTLQDYGELLNHVQQERKYGESSYPWM